MRGICCFFYAFAGFSGLRTTAVVSIRLFLCFRRISRFTDNGCREYKAFSVLFRYFPWSISHEEAGFAGESSEIADFSASAMLKQFLRKRFRILRSLPERLMPGSF